MDHEPHSAPDIRIPLLLVGIALFLLMLAAGCNGVTTPVPQPEVRTFHFTEETHGWVGDFADYPPEWAEQMELEAEHAPLPDALEEGGQGLRIAGSNNSDDLFMFWKGRAEGLAPNTTYAVYFEVDLATSAPSDCVGIGGPPGESIWVKAGATAPEPEPVIEQVGGSDYYRMNIDKGNQSTGGQDALLLGDASNSNTDCQDPVWEVKTLESEEALAVVTDEDGALWLFVGTDSGFEGRTELYYIRYEASFQPA